MFKWNDNGQPKTQYRFREKNNVNGLADGSYYAEIVYEEVRNGYEYLTVDMLKVAGYACSDNIIFESTGEGYTMEVAAGCVISDSSVFTETGLTKKYYDSIGPIIDQYGFGTKISFEVSDGKITNIDKFYIA